MSDTGMTDDQFVEMMAVLNSINEKLHAMVVSGAQQEAQTNALFEALSQPSEEPTSVQPYFAQRLLQGSDLSAG